MKKKSRVYLSGRGHTETMKLIRQNWTLYLFILPALLYIIVFCYFPIYGLQIAFKNYSLSKGFAGSAWVGLKWFNKFFNTPRFWSILSNTLSLSIYNLAVSFPLPIILALALNSIRNERFKKLSQTITYMPHFISTVVLVGMMSSFFSPTSGFINTLLGHMGFSGNTHFMGIPAYFDDMYVWSGVWQQIGWNSIIYLAALSSVDMALHEAAMLDGASKLQRVLHVDIPCIAPTIIILLVMRVGQILNVGYEKVYLMQNSLNLTKAEVISTYVYKVGIQDRMYSYSSAIGLFNNAVSFIMLISVNKLARRLSGSSLW